MSTARKNRTKIWIILGVVVLLGALIAGNILVKRKPKGQKVDVTTAKLDSLTQTVTASGKIQPKTDVNISANVSGRILKLGAEEGDVVREGELLVQIEDKNYAAQVEQAQYSLASSEANLEQARATLKRTKDLHSRSLASDSDLEAADASVKRFTADVAGLKANVAQAEDALSKTRIYSPIAGTVTQLNKKVGEMAIGATFSQDVIMVVSKLDSMEVDAEVNENDVVLLKPDDPVKIEVFAMPDTSFRGKVTEIAHSGVVRNQGTSEEVTNFNVKVEVTDKVPELRPGMSATVEIVTASRTHTLVLPQEAVAVRTLSVERKDSTEARGRHHHSAKKKKDGEFSNMDQNSTTKEEPREVVFVVRNDTAWARPVKLGIYSDTHFEILEGIQAGDVVVSGPFRLLSRELHSGAPVSYTMPMKGAGADSSKTKKD